MSRAPVAVAYTFAPATVDRAGRLVLSRLVEQGALIAADGHRVELAAAPALEACARAGLSVEEAVERARAAMGGGE